MDVRSRTAGVGLLVALSTLLLGGARPSAQDPVELVPTVHPALPTNASDFWLVPSENDRAARTLATYEPLVTGVARLQAGNYPAAIALLERPALAGTALGDYAAYYVGVSQLRQGQPKDARRTFEKILEKKPNGNVAIA